MKIEEAKIECEKQGYQLVKYNSSKDIVIKDSDGYKYNTSVSSLFNQSGHNAMQSNRYAGYNLNRHAELNSNGSFHVIQDSYIDSKHKVSCRCDLHPNETIHLNPLSIWRKNAICPKCKRDAARHDRLLQRAGEIKDFVENKGCVFDHIEYGEKDIVAYYTCPKHNTRELIKDYWFKLKRRNNICKYCVGKERTDEEYKALVTQLHPNIMVLDKYKKYDERVKCRCLVCNTEWEVRAGSLIAKRLRGCPTCGRKSARDSRSKSKEQFIEDLKKVNDKLVVEGEYVNTHTLIDVRCTIHNVVFSRMPCNLLNKTATCPMCAKGNWKTEKLVGNVLKELNITAQPQHKFPGCKGQRKHLLFDYYLPDYNVAIEYDGEQHYYPIDYFGGEKGFKRRKEYDKIKTNYCLENDIRLIRVPYYKKDNLKEYLISQLNQNVVPAP